MVSHLFYVIAELVFISHRYLQSCVCAQITYQHFLISYPPPKCHSCSALSFSLFSYHSGFFLSLLCMTCLMQLAEIRKWEKELLILIWFTNFSFCYLIPYLCYC